MIDSKKETLALKSKGLTDDNVIKALIEKKENIHHIATLHTYNLVVKILMM